MNQKQKIQDMQEEIDNHRFYIQLFKKAHEDAVNNNPKAVFLFDHVFNYGKTEMVSNHHSILCGTENSNVAEVQEYTHCHNKILKLPCRTALQKYIGSGQDVTELIEKRLKAEANSLKPIEKICCLIIDSITIKEKMYYSRRENKIYS